MIRSKVKVHEKVKNYWTELHEIFRDDLPAIRSEVKIKVTKRSKMYFCHNALSFRPIHMKPMPKCSLFNSLSSDMVTDVSLAKVCALPSARSN